MINHWKKGNQFYSNFFSWGFFYFSAGYLRYIKLNIHPFSMSAVSEN